MITNIAAERAVLAALCQYASEAHTDCIDLLRPEIFTDTKNSLIYLTLSSLLKNNRTEIDIASIYSEATSLNYNNMICEKQEDKDYLKALFNFSISVSNVRDQVALLYKLYVARTLQDSAKRTFKELDEINGTEGLDSIISIPEKNLTSTINKLSYEDDIEIIGNSVDEYLEYLSNGNNNMLGIPSPYPIYNHVIGNLRPGISCLAARIKQGKSVFCKEIGINIAMNGIPTFYVDTEMTWDEQLTRMISSMAKIPIRDIETGKFRHDPSANKKVKIAADILRKIPLVHKNVSGQNYEEIISLLKRWVHKCVGIDSSTGRAKSPCVVIWDYIKLMNTDSLKSMKEYESLGYTMNAMHDFSKQYNCPIFAACQLNRDGATNTSDVNIASSDRIGWACTNLSIFRRKTSDEIGEEGIKNGNAKLIPILGRQMQNLDDGDHINFLFDKDTLEIKELNTRYGSLQKEFKVKEDE